MLNSDNFSDEPTNTCSRLPNCCETNAECPICSTCFTNKCLLVGCSLVLVPDRLLSRRGEVIGIPRRLAANRDAAVTFIATVEDGHETRINFPLPSEIVANSRIESISWRTTYRTHEAAPPEADDWLLFARLGNGGRELVDIFSSTGEWVATPLRILEVDDPVVVRLQSAEHDTLTYAVQLVVVVRKAAEVKPPPLDMTLLELIVTYGDGNGTFFIGDVIDTSAKRQYTQTLSFIP